jgi:hypothetical protein
MKEECKLWLTKEAEKRMLACVNGWQKGKCLTNEKYVPLRERMRRRIGGNN